MKRTNLNQKGFHLLLASLGIAVIAAIGIVGYAVYNNARNKADAPVRWTYNERQNSWQTSQGTAPECPEPLVFDYTPVSLDTATSVGFSGTYRGKNYKVHGTFGLAKSTSVVLPADATLSGLTRYYEGDPQELQYLVSFEMDCGIAFYFDHLHTLSPQLMALADKQPQPKSNDTQSSPDDAPPRIQLKAGEIIATETGNHSVNNFGIDFGVVDYRKRNKISANSVWASIHNQYPASEWFGVCWLDMLPGDDAKKAKQLSLVQVDTRRTAKHVSDYCDTADYTTLDIADGQPVDYY